MSQLYVVKTVCQPLKAAVWGYFPFIVQNRGTGGDNIRLRGVTGASGTRFLDDVYIVLLDDVSLTITPTSLLNSAENGGLRVDGWICVLSLSLLEY